jgi:hypothetical protein
VSIQGLCTPHHQTRPLLPPGTHHNPQHWTTRARAPITDPPTWYRPPCTHYMSQRPPYHPCMRPAPRQHPRIKMQERHVTATRRVRNRGPAGSNQTEPLRYIPPTLRSNNRASWRSQLPNPHLSKNSRDLPPHKDPPAQNPKRSDSLDWRSPSPNRPISFRNPSPPQSPPAPPASPLLTPKTPQTTQQYHLESQLGSELINLIKATSEALRSIAQVVEKLIRRANAGHRLAHKSQRPTWSLREDTHGNTVCSQPPVFPSGRGVSAARLPEVSEAIA